MNRSREEWFKAMLQMTESEWEKFADALLTSNVVPPQAPVAQQLAVKCTECQDFFSSRGKMIAHRKKVHQYEDLAIKYWRENRGECPFCRCFFREGDFGASHSSFAHFTVKPDARDGHESAGVCYAAYLAWEASRAPLPEGRTVQPTLQKARAAVLTAIVDLESEASIRNRVETWKGAKSVRRDGGAAALKDVHSISLIKGQYNLSVSLTGVNDVIKTKRSALLYTLADVIAERDRVFLEAALKLREKTVESGAAAPEQCLAGEQFKKKRPGDSKLTGTARENSHAWRRLGAIAAPAPKPKAQPRPKAVAKAQPRPKAKAKIRPRAKAQPKRRV